MKAIIYSASGGSEVAERPMPVVREGEALIRVRAGGICGTDIAIVSGKHPRAKPGVVLGHEFCGDVAEVRCARGATAVREGDKVTLYPLLTCGACWACRNGCAHVCKTLRLIGIDEDGGFAEYVKAPADLLFRLPADMDDDVGSLIEPLAVGAHAVNMGGIRGGERCVVMGAGPIGLVTGLALKHRGIATVFVTDVDPYRLALAAQFGFTALNARTEDVGDRVRQATDGEGADALFECAGAESAAMDMAGLVRSRGTIVMVSVHKDAHRVDLRSINFKEITLVGSRVYERRDYDEAIEIARSFAVSRLISHRFPIDQGPAAIELMKNGKDTCKVLIRMT